MTLTGAIGSDGNIDINAGVSRNWTLDTLTGAIDRTTLSGGSITISQRGNLTAKGSVNLKAGADIILNADNSGTENAPVVIPVVSTETREVEIIIGYQQVYKGTHTENDITITKTLITEQVGTEKVVVGHKNYRMDVTLEQIGYYNPNAPEGAKFREVLIEGIDYFNDKINWSKAGNEALPTRTAAAVPGNYKDPAYREFQALNDAQKQAVLNNTGYMPLYVFAYGTTINGTYYDKKVSLEQTINGTPTTNAVDPLWKNNAEKIYRIDVAGWRDKYVLMPEGANKDILNVVSQGEARYLSGDTTMDGMNNGSWVSATAAGVLYTKAGATTRTEFIPGTDYSNTGTFWTTYGAQAPQANATWTELSAAQQNAVAMYLGYTTTFDAKKGEYIGRYQDYADIDYTQDKSRFNNTYTTLVVETDLTGKNARTGATTTDDTYLEGLWSKKESSVDNDGSDARWAVTYNTDQLNNTGAYANAVEGSGTRATANVDGTGYRVYEVQNELGAIGQNTDRTTDRNRDPNWVWTTGGTVAADDPWLAQGRYTDNIWIDAVLLNDYKNNTSSLVPIAGSETTRTATNVGSYAFWDNYYGEGGSRYDNDGWNDDPDESEMKRSGWELYNASWDFTLDWHGENWIKSRINENTRVWLAGNYFDDGWGDYKHDLSWKFQDAFKVTIDETQHDYTYDWTSKWSDIYDTGSTRLPVGDAIRRHLRLPVDLFDHRKDHRDPHTQRSHGLGNRTHRDHGGTDLDTAGHGQLFHPRGVCKRFDPCRHDHHRRREERFPQRQGHFRRHRFCVCGGYLDGEGLYPFRQYDHAVVCRGR
jgi:hypothetical protein